MSERVENAAPGATDGGEPERFVEYGLVSGSERPADPEEYMARLYPTNKGGTIEVRREDGEVVWSAEGAASGFADRTTVGSWKNDLLTVLDDDRTDMLAVNFKTICEKIHNSLTSAEAEFRAPAVRRILDLTRHVGKVKAEEVTVVVTLADETGNYRTDVEFSAGEWLDGATGKLRQAYWSEFDEYLDFGDGAWEQLRSAWDEQMVIDVEERHTSEDQAVQTVVDRLDKRLELHPDEADLDLGENHAWYETDHESGSEFDGEDVIWVNSAALTTQLAETPKGEEWLNVLSTRLKRHGYTYAGSTSKTGGGGQIYPFKPSAFDELDPSDVASDEQPEVEL